MVQRADLGTESQDLSDASEAREIESQYDEEYTHRRDIRKRFRDKYHEISVRQLLFSDTKTSSFTTYQPLVSLNGQTHI
jgi:hypothetical protein